MPDTLIVGLGHYSNVGKDTLAKMLVEEIDALYNDGGFHADIHAFAHTLKDYAESVFRWAGVMHMSYYEANRDQRDVVIPELGMTPVELWCRVGEAMRTVHPDVWLNNTLYDIDYGGQDIALITDVRYPNEAEAIQKRGGLLIKVLRPGVEPRDTEADRALLDFDNWNAVVSASNLDELREHARKLAKVIYRTWGQRP